MSNDVAEIVGFWDRLESLYAVFDVQDDHKDHSNGLKDEVMVVGHITCIEFGVVEIVANSECSCMGVVGQNRILSSLTES